MRKKGASRLSGCSTESSIGPIRRAASRGISFPRSSSFGSRRRRRPGRSTEPPSYSSASEGDPLLPPELHCSHGKEHLRSQIEGSRTGAELTANEIELVRFTADRSEQ